MRQAGRYQAAYRKIKEKYSIIDISTIPELCAEVTLLPIKQFNLDSAIVFSDILIPLKPMGISFEYKAGYGPLIHNPVKNDDDVSNLKPIFPEQDLKFTGDALKILEQELNVPCIGFVGAPFTLASYLIEGGPSKNYIKLKSFMYNQTTAWNILMNKLAVDMANYLNFQIESGASVVQIFDSWIGILDKTDYLNYVYPHMQKMMSIIKERNNETPVILFGVNTSHLLTTFKNLQPDVIGIDWKTDLMNAWQELGLKDVAVQGNLDPTVLFASKDIIKAKAKAILDSVNHTPGHIFNLGHGILPGTPEDNVKFLVDFVHEYSAK
jgi:uroporphyrinogen decarboxylase